MEKGSMTVIVSASTKRIIEQAISDFRNAGHVHYNRFDPPAVSEFLGDIRSIRYAGRNFHLKPLPCLLPEAPQPVLKFRPPTADSYDGDKLPRFLSDEVGQCQPPDHSPSPSIIKELALIQEEINSCWHIINTIIEKAQK